MTEQTISIAIYSDVICPWCYVGKRRLEHALDQLRDTVTARVAWKPFQLNPTMPKEGVDRTAYLEAKFGSLGAFKRLEEHVLAAGLEERIPFAFEKISRTPNTLMAHRMIWYAGQRGCQNALVDSFFKGYFEEGADIGSSSTLAQLADRAGLNTDTFLNSDEGTNQVKAEEAEGRKLGIRSVPYFQFNDTHALSGAQPPDRFVAAMRKVLDEPISRKAGV